jgi:hypothetical protein
VAIKVSRGSGGEFESGLTASWFGAVPSGLLGGFGTLLIVAAWVKLFPLLARRERLVPQEHGSSALCLRICCNHRDPWRRPATGSPLRRSYCGN